MNTLLQMTISLVLGSIFVVNGIAVKTDDIIASAKAAVNGANLHQIATVVELYYSDHEHYPKVSGGEELVNLLADEGYIMNRPLDPSVFEYNAENNGQNYRLALAE